MMMKQIDILDDYIVELEQRYLSTLNKIHMFNDTVSIQLSAEQKKLFAAVFYHLRGHFINFMWFLANFTTDGQAKSLVLDNISEEIGSQTHLSHEMLYDHFAKACGVDIKQEIIFETNMLPFAKQYNRQHLQWLAEHDADDRLAAFSAYERLDNVDYPILLTFAKRFELPASAMTFFTVHIHVKHFDHTRELLNPIWEKDPEKVKRAFSFIYDHQLWMWQQLSDLIF